MIDASSIPAEKLKTSLRMIRDQAIARGWKAWIYYVGNSHMRLQRPDGKLLEIFSTTPPSLSFVAAHRADDKYFTHIALQQVGLPVSETFLLQSNEDHIDQAKTLIAQGKKLVVKPLDAAHGNGITVGIADSAHIMPAIEFAKQYSDKIIIQEHVEQPIDLRLTCINYKFVGAVIRVPARVQGDGLSTIAQLIDTENDSSSRGENYHRALNVIDAQQAEKYLKSRMQEVIAAGEWTQVLGTANMGTGGETIEISDDIPQWLIAMAEKAARTIDLPVCGVDFLVKMVPAIDLTLEELSPVIIEINKCPSFFLHDTPIFGKPRNVTAMYLDYLEKL